MDSLGPTPVEFFTQQYRFAGMLKMGGQRLTDLLNDDLSSSVELRRVQVTRLIDPKEAASSHVSALMEKKAILFAIGKGEEGADAATRSYYKRVGTTPWDVFLTVASFELSGRLHVRGTADLRTSLLTWVGDFIPLTGAKAVYTLFPEVSFSSDLIVVNKPHIEVICIDAKSAL